MMLDAHTACDVWNTATRLFAAVVGAKLSRISHDLHSLKKSNLSIKEYVAKIQNTCALIKAFESWILEGKKVEIVFTCLPLKFDIMLTLPSFSFETLAFQRLVNMLLEYEMRQMRTVQELSIHANLVESVPSPPIVNSVRGGHPPSGDRGKGFRSSIQCQICSRFVYLAQQCYYCYNRYYNVGSMALRHSLEEIFVLRLTCLGSTRVSNPFVVFDDGFGHNAAEPRLQFGPGYVSSPLALGRTHDLALLLPLLLLLGLDLLLLGRINMTIILVSPCVPDV
ncbi:hypothetical protein PVK06_012491 [Gossypium arboreum]|uniref:Retrotransposon gag domain-containing protein n=1 Tax=Gossypium arboreum TaxID=29729 RepID=A0ABR0QCL6_GOSAR|nr:hypothetical protein PVK06_012491 [Gossypium arboreum]